MGTHVVASSFVPSPDGLSLVPACSLVKVRIKSSSSVDFLEGARRRESKIPRVLHAGRKGSTFLAAVPQFAPGATE